MDWLCDLCKLNFSSQQELLTHSYCHKNDISDNSDRVADKENNFACGLCKKTFSKYGWFVQHMNSCKAPFECLLCSKSFTDPRNLRNHLNLHTHDTKFKCEFCDKPFYRQDKLLIHQRTHSKGTGELFCSTCGKNYRTTKDLKRHHQSHEETTFYECNSCPKKYKRRHSLRSHMLTHKNESPHVCKHCKQRFWSKNHLNRHESIHEFDPITKDCLCLVCGIRHDTNALENHIGNAHAGEKKFKCNVCLKSFHKKGNLSYHSKSHTFNNN